MNCILSIVFFVESSSPTDGLSGSGGAGETPYQLLHILANRAYAERQSRCPLEPVLGAFGKEKN
jgi:hypothetical protein